MKEHLFDKRVVTRALQEGLLDKEVYQRMIDELPDLSHKVQTAAESQALEAASQASASALDDADYDDIEGDDDDEDGDEPAASASGALPGDTLEMERPRIPGSYTPGSDY